MTIIRATIRDINIGPNKKIIAAIKTIANIGYLPIKLYFFIVYKFCYFTFKT